MTIHHAVLKKAAKTNITIREPEHGYFVATTEGRQDALAEGGDAKKVLADAIAVLNPKPVKEPKAKKPAKPKKARKTRDADEDGEDEEGEEGGTKSVITAKYRAKYKPNKDTCGDPLIQPVFEFTHPDGEDCDVGRLMKLGKDNGVDVMDRWGHLKTKTGAFNVGMARMNLVNVLRGKLRRGEDITIGSKTVKGQKKDKA